MEKEPLVSVITATRNRKNFVEKLIKSLLSQTYANIEHVVIDGLSSDGTQELLKKCEKQYRLRWISESDKNQVEAINKGLRIAKGDFITITHDDDYWLPHGIETLMDRIRKNPSIDIIYGDSWGEYGDGRRVRRSFKQYTLDQMVNGGYQIPQDSSIFRRAWLEKVGYLNEDFEYVPEYEFFLRVIRAGGKHEHIPEITSVGGLHGQKKSWVGVDRSWEETLRANRMHGGKFFSRVTLLYFKNRYFQNASDFVKRISPSFFKYVRKKAKLPEYE